MTNSAPSAMTYEASPPVAPAVTYMGEAPMVESVPAVTYGAAPAVTYGAPDMTYFPPPPVALAVTYMGEAASVATAPAVTYGAPPVVTYSGPSAVTCSPQPQVTPAVTYMGAAPVAPAPAFTDSAVPQVPPAVIWVKRERLLQHPRTSDMQRRMSLSLSWQVLQGRQEGVNTPFVAYAHCCAVVLCCGR